VTGAISLFERISGRTLSRRVYVWIFVVSFSFVGIFMAWREQFQRAEKAELALGQKPTLPIQINVPPAPPAQVVFPPPTEAALKSKPVSPCLYPLPFQQSPLGDGPPFSRDVRVTLKGATDVTFYTDTPFFQLPTILSRVQPSSTGSVERKVFISYTDTPPETVDLQFKNSNRFSVGCVDRTAARRWLEVGHSESNRTDTPSNGFTEMVVSVNPVRIATDTRLRFYFEANWKITGVSYKAFPGVVGTLRQLNGNTLEVIYPGALPPTLPFLMYIDGQGSAPRLDAIRHWGSDR
jgi:hypothetical protein